MPEGGEGHFTTVDRIYIWSAIPKIVNPVAEVDDVRSYWLQLMLMIIFIAVEFIFVDKIVIGDSLGCGKGFLVQTL